MASLIIKVSKDGSSREYIFSKLGPIVLGSDEKCDIRLEDTEPKLLEVKLSTGSIFVKELGVREQMFLDNVIIPFREEIPYQLGKSITMANSRYQIQILKGEEASDPPPFFTEDYKRVLEDLKKKIKEKEEVLALSEKTLEKRRLSMESMDSFIRTKMAERNKREIEVEFLNQKLNEITHELAKKHVLIDEENNNLKLAHEHMEQLKEEDRHLNQTVHQNESNLQRIKGDIDRFQLELKEQKETLASLHYEEKKAQNALAELKRESSEAERQTAAESQKIQGLLIKSDAALREKHQIEIKIERLKQESSETQKTLDYLQQKIEDQEKHKLSEEAKLQALAFDIERLEQQLSKYKQNLVLEQEKERQLKRLNEELRLELNKVEEKLTAKKNLSHQLDYQTLDASKKLVHIKGEIETSIKHLEDLNLEERTQDMKMMGLRQEQELFQKKIAEEKKNLIDAFEIVKFTQEQELSVLKIDVNRNRLELNELVHSLEQAQKTQNEITSANKTLQKEKNELEAKIEALTHRKSELEKAGHSVIENNSSLALEKGRLENEISLLRIKLLDCEGLIRQRETEAQVELDNLRRDERHRLAQERELMLSEVAAEKQKGEIHLASVLKDKEEKVHLLKMEGLKASERMLKDAQDEAARIVAKAMMTEQQATEEATRRLNDISQEVFEREQKANFRINEAQSYYEQKEREAELIVSKSKKLAQDIVRDAELDLARDLQERKQNIKGYLSQRQQKGQAHIELLEEFQKRRLKKSEEVVLRNLETHKRKEYKKIARLKMEEASQAASLKENFVKTAKQENEKTFLELKNLKRKQEAELAEAKKAFLEQLSTTKLRQQRSLEEALQRQKEEYEQTKNKRLENATQAVINALITQSGSLPVGGSEKLREQIEGALDMALNGRNPETQKKVEQILDYNPLKKKAVWPVMRKYALHYGAPAALVITLLTDIGSFRSNLVDYGYNLLKSTESASDKFVSNQREEWKEKYTFNPTTTVGYKDTYTNNILYTTDFYTVMESEAFQNEWLLAVNDFLVTNLELSEDIAISFISSEGTMVKEMWQVRSEINPKFLDQGIRKLKDLEAAHLSWLPIKISDPEKLKQFMDYKKEYYDKYYAENVVKGRNLATQEEPVP